MPIYEYECKKCKVKKIYKTGGAHTIAAFTYGTKNFDKVDKIVGPGNTYVASAKTFERAIIPWRGLNYGSC